MKILVSGHKGYLGNEFVKKYGKHFEIVGYDLQEGNDLLDYTNLTGAMRDCEQVVHLAAIPRQ